MNNNEYIHFLREHEFCFRLNYKNFKLFENIRLSTFQNLGFYNVFKLNVAILSIRSIQNKLSARATQHDK